jgi:hypothetical protein
VSFGWLYIGYRPLDYTGSSAIKVKLGLYSTEYNSLKQQHEALLADEARRRRKTFPLEDRLHKWIVGQDGPVMAVSSAIRRKENGWHNEDHPLVFLFLGSSGVGKVSCQTPDVVFRRWLPYIRSSLTLLSSCRPNWQSVLRNTSTMTKLRRCQQPLKASFAWT